MRMPRSSSIINWLSFRSSDFVHLKCNIFTRSAIARQPPWTCNSDCSYVVPWPRAQRRSNQNRKGHGGYTPTRRWTAELEAQMLRSGTRTNSGRASRWCHLGLRAHQEMVKTATESPDKCTPDEVERLGQTLQHRTTAATFLALR